MTVGSFSGPSDDLYDYETENEYSEGPITRHRTSEEYETEENESNYEDESDGRDSQGDMGTDGPGNGRNNETRYYTKKRR
jgi:hypothetical protein